MPQESTVQTRESGELVSLMLETYHQLTSLLPLDELMPRIAEAVKRVIDYEIFAIFLLNEKTQKLSVRFSLGHPQRRGPDLADWDRGRHRRSCGGDGTAGARQ